MTGLLNRVQDFRKTRVFKFLLVGGLNTLLGYLLSVGVHALLEAQIHIVLIGIINAVLCINLSFITNRVWVFESVAPWLPEYLRIYAVNALAMLANVVLIWLAVDVADMPFWLAQGMITTILTIYMYFAHTHFTFK